MGLLTDFLGSMAQAGGSIMEQDRKAQEEAAKEMRLLERQKAMADYTADLNAKKQELLEQLREEREQRKQQAFVDANDQAEEGMLKIGNDRRFQAFKSKLGQTDATDEELKPLFDQYYNNKSVVAGDKLDTQFVDKRTDTAGDYRKAAQQTGNLDVIKSARDQMSEAQKLDAADAKDARDRAELARKEARDEARHEESMARIDRSAGKVDPTHRLALTTQLNAANKDVTELRKSLAAFDANLANKMSKDPEVAAQRKQLVADLEEAKTVKRDLLDQFKTLGIPHPEVDAPAKTDAEKRGMSSSGGSKYAGIGSDGKPTYVSTGKGSAYNPDGTANPNYIAPSRGSDAVVIVKKEYDAAIADGRQADAAALAKELKRLGVNVSAEPSQSKPSGGQSINTLPAGAKQIGTSKGRPVYELPDGKRIIAS